MASERWLGLVLAMVEAPLWIRFWRQSGACGADDVCQLGDYIGWIGAITVFALFWALIHFLWRRAHSKGGSSLPELLQQIGELDRLIKELSSTIKRLSAQLTEANTALAEATTQRDELQRKVRDHEQLNAGGVQVFDAKPESPLLVAIGSDAKLKLDLASLRAVETDTGMTFRRIENATFELLKRHLDRARANDRPYDKLHLAVHSGPDGIYLSGGIVNSEQLSEILRGVRILVIAGCESDAVGDYLGVVNHVVSMTEKVSHTDAALFARAFWEEIGNRCEPSEALRLALKRSPSGMSEYVEYHW